MTKLKSIRGMHDLLGEDYFSQKEIIKLFEYVANNFNFKPIETPKILKALISLWSNLN